MILYDKDSHGGEIYDNFTRLLTCIALTNVLLFDSWAKIESAVTVFLITLIYRI